MTFTVKPTSYSVVTGQTHCPDHLWMIDEGSGTVLIDRGKTGGYNLSFAAANTGTGPTWISDTLSGNSCPALSFNSSNGEYAVCNSVSGLSGVQTIAVLVKGSNGSVARAIVHLSDTTQTDRSVDLVYQGDEDLEPRSRFDDTLQTNPSTQALTHTDYDLVFLRFDDQTFDWSMNGSPWATWTASPAHASGLVAAINRISLGGVTNNTVKQNFWNDQIMAAMWWHGSKSIAEISSIASDPWQFLTTSSPPTFTVAPTVTSKTNTSFTASFTPNQSCNAYAVAVIAGSTAPSIAQIKAGQDGSGGTAKASASKSVTGADTLTLTPSDSPAFPRYDLYYVLNSAGGDSSRITLASEYLNPPTGKQFTTITSLDGTSPFFDFGVSTDDTVVIDLLTTPDSYSVNCAVDGTVSYAANGSTLRQFIDVDVYDYSANSYLGSGSLVFNNFSPGGPAFTYPLLYQKDVAITPIDLSAYVSDPEGDSIIATALDVLPSGLTITTSEMSGTPLVYGETNTQIQWSDPYDSTYVETLTIQVGDLVPNVVGNLQATAISTITGIASLTTVVETVSSPNVAVGYVVSTDPVAGVLVNYNTPITLYVANGTTITMTTLALPEGLRNAGYSGQLTADGAVTAWSLVSGLLPTGLSLNTVTGEISGVPTVAGTFIFTVGCTNGIDSDTQSLSIKILFGQTTTPGSIPSITVDPPTNEAIAVVGNVSQGSIEGLYVKFPGYGYRTYTNTQTTVYRSIGDDPNANLSTDIRVSGITTANASVNTNDRFVETIIVDKMPILYAANLTLSNTGDWSLFSSNVMNMSVTLNGTPGSGAAKWYQFEDWYADSNGSYETANITGKILTANTGWTGGPSTIVLYSVANNARPLTLLVGNLITTVNSTKNYTVTAILDSQVDVNANSQICSALNFEHIETGGVALYNIINGGYGFRTTPSVGTRSFRETYLSETYAFGTPEHANTQQLMGLTGQIAHIYVSNGGSGYANGDAIIVGGSGYGFTGNVIIGANGTVVGTTINNRGEGYYGSISANVTSANGMNAYLIPYGFGEGISVGVETGAIGRVKDIRMIYRGSGYTITPIISMKVVDMVINGIADNESINEGDRVYQGDTLATATFQGIVKSFNRSTNLLRLFNYSGNSFENFEPSIGFTSTRGVIFYINLDAKVPAPDAYPEAVKATGLPNPWFYGNGKAKGIAEFYNGLIKFNGFYVNTDGFLSSDKKIQDSKTYHNYSYVVESEKSLSQYSASMKDIVHPIGMVMLGRTISKSELSEKISTQSIATTIPHVNANATISVSNSYNVIITGANSLFNLTANVGDMLLLKDNVHTLRSQAKIITAVNSNTSINVESNFVYVGQGKLTTNAGNNVVHISGNTNTLSDFISTGDRIRINVGNVEIFQITLGSGNTLTINNTANTTNTNIVYCVVPDYTSAMVYEIIKVAE